MASARGIRAGAAYVELFADDSRLIRGLSRASRRLKAFGAGVQAMGAGMRDVGMRLVGVGTAMIAPLLGAAKVFSEMGDSLAKMSARTGVSVEALSELAFAAQQSGADMDALETGIKRMQKAVVAAATGSKEATDTLTALGLTVADLDGLSPEQQFKLIADRISKIENPTVRAAAALQLFGRSGTGLLPLIGRGAAGLEALQQEARRLGLTISTTDAKAAEAFHDTLSALWQTVKRGVFAVGAALAPTLSDLARRVTDVVVRATDWIKANRGIIVSVLKIAAAVVAAGVALVGLGYAVSAFGAIFTGLGTILGGVSTALGVLGAVLGFILSPLGLVVTAAAALGAYLVWASGAGGKALAWLGDRFDDLKTEALAAWQGIADALAAGDIGLAAQILWLTLKMWWQKGVHWLMGYWLDWKKHLLDTATDAWYGLQAIWVIGSSTVAKVWTECLATMKTVWTVFTGLVGLGWNSLQNTLTKGILKVMSLFDDSFDYETAAAGADRAAAASRKRIVRETDAQLAGIDAAMKSRLGEIQAGREQGLTDISRKAQDARRRHEAEYQSDLAQTEADLAAARKEWEDAIAAAREKRASAEQAALMEPGPPEVKAPTFEGLKNLAQAIEEAEKRTIGVRGAFSAVEAAGLGAGGVTDRLANAAEQTAKNTKRIADWTRDAEATFD